MRQTALQAEVMAQRSQGMIWLFGQRLPEVFFVENMDTLTMIAA
jgi:hypothetical protein